MWLKSNLIKGVLENILEDKMEEQLGRSKYQCLDADDFKKVNYRNVYSKKNLRSSFWNVDPIYLKIEVVNSSLR